SEFYPSSAAVRLTIDKHDELKELLPPHTRIWLDPAIDSFHHEFAKIHNTSWVHFIRKITGYEQLADRRHLLKPDRGAVDAFVAGLLSFCADLQPSAITVPQLPLTDGSERNKMNRALANATARWKAASSYRGRIVLPVIFTHQNQINLKTSRTKK